MSRRIEEGQIGNPLLIYGFVLWVIGTGMGAVVMWIGRGSKKARIAVGGLAVTCFLATIVELNVKPTPASDGWTGVSEFVFAVAIAIVGVGLLSAMVAFGRSPKPPDPHN